MPNYPNWYKNNTLILIVPLLSRIHLKINDTIHTFFSFGSGQSYTINIRQHNTSLDLTELA